MQTIYIQAWEESEAGWGVRPDGYSLHATREDVYYFIAAYWERMPAATPTEYSRPNGEPAVLNVRDDVYETVVASGHGTWYNGNLAALTNAPLSSKG